MKKTFRTLSAIVLSAALLGTAVAVPVMAADVAVPIQNAPNDRGNHSYYAFRIFQAELADIGGTQQFINIAWDDAYVNGDAILTALKAKTIFGTGEANLFKDCSSAADVANVLESFAVDSAQAFAFAEVVSANLKGKTEPTETGFLGQKVGDNTNKIPGPGYYIVKDYISGSLDSTGSQYAYSDYILRVVTDSDLAKINAKTEVPTLDKNIQESTKVKTNPPGVGDSLNFVLESAVPDRTYYNEYFFIISDDLCDGFTFNDDVAITIGTKTLERDTDFEVKHPNASDPDDFQIVFLDFYESYNTAAYKGKPITVTYSATLNENAEIGETGNPNTVNLTFSNNPTFDYQGEDEPTDEEKTKDNVLGVTPDSTTKTFTSGLKLQKVDERTGLPLAGAKFTISGAGVKTVLINNEVYRPGTGATATYYMLKDGTFTKTEPTAETQDSYDSTTIKYEKINEITKTTAAEPVNLSAYSDSDGVISFKGLKAGTYTIHEDKAPEGYNPAADIVITLTGTTVDDTLTCTWSATKDSAPSGALTADDDGPFKDLFKFDVQNNKGIILPGTGGIGTTIFYVVGVLFIAGGAVLLISKKRMNIKEK